MESLGEILRRLQQQSTSVRSELPAEWLAAVETAMDEPQCPICRGAAWVRHDVPTNHRDFGKAFPCVCQRNSDDRQVLTRLRRFSNMGKLADVSFASTQPEGVGDSTEQRKLFRQAFEFARKYADDPHGAIALEGGPGTGKTHLAAAIANRLMLRGKPMFFAFVPDLLDHLRSSYSAENGLNYDEMFDQVKSVPVLVLDDLGTHSGTPWAEEKLFQVLNHRYLAELPTVVTTSTAVDRLDSRLQSRLLDKRFTEVLKLGGGAKAGAPGLGSIEPKMLKQMTFDNFESTGKATNAEHRKTLSQAFTFAQAYAEDPLRWLVLVGDSGTGKTHLAVAIAAERLSRGEEVFFALAPDLLDHLRYTFNPDSRITYDELFERIKQTPLLILDDLGSQTSSAWANEKLYQLIVHRFNAELPTVITTRALPANSKDPIASRLNDQSKVRIEALDAPDFRQEGFGSRRQRQREPRSR